MVRVTICNLLFGLIVGIVSVRCVSEPKPQRDAHGSIVREEPFAADVEYKRRAEEVRKTGSYGITQLAERCSKVKTGDVTFVPSCEYDYIIRLKILCEVPQGVGVPFHQPMRFKEVKLNMMNIGSATLKDKKRFPTKLTTSQDGELDFSFTTIESLGNFQIELSLLKGSVVVDKIRTIDPILVPEVFCSKN